MIDTAAVILTAAGSWAVARRRANATAVAAAALAGGATLCLFLPGDTLAEEIARAAMAAFAAAFCALATLLATRRKA